MKSKHISILLPNLGGGGAERAYLELAYEFAKKNYHVEFVVMRLNGELLTEAKETFSIVDLQCSRLRNLPIALIRYFRKSQPKFMITAMWPLTVIAPFSKFFSNHSCKIIICEQNNLSHQYQKFGFIKKIAMRISMSLGYRLAYARVGVSKGVVDIISNLSGLQLKKFEVINNPVSQCKEASSSSIIEVEKRWSCPPGTRVISVGSFKSQKNHQLLFKAIANIKNPNIRLMLVGDGEDREKLKNLAKKLKIETNIIFVGFQIDLSPFYKTSDLFVLSSDYEGFGNVIVEALSYGIPVVSTDCPYGPSEILDNGRFGTLVPVGDIDALAIAIKEKLNSLQKNNYNLMKRASEFFPEILASKYLRLLNEID